MVLTEEGSASERQTPSRDDDENEADYLTAFRSPERGKENESAPGINAGAIIARLMDFNIFLRGNDGGK
jgi:hypothetical protein